MKIKPKMKLVNERTYTYNGVNYSYDSSEAQHIRNLVAEEKHDEALSFQVKKGHILASPLGLAFVFPATTLAPESTKPLPPKPIRKDEDHPVTQNDDPKSFANVLRKPVVKTGLKTTDKLQYIKLKPYNYEKYCTISSPNFVPTPEPDFTESAWGDETAPSTPMTITLSEYLSRKRPLDNPEEPPAKSFRSDFVDAQAGVVSKETKEGLSVYDQPLENVYRHNHTLNRIPRKVRSITQSHLSQKRK